VPEGWLPATGFSETWAPAKLIGAPSAVRAALSRPTTTVRVSRAVTVTVK